MTEAIAHPAVLVVMGVSGSGKSTVAARLAQRLGQPFADGDDFHAPESVARMRQGHPLDDDARGPWLARIRAWIDARLADGTGGVVACSALKRAYRAALTGNRPAVRIVYLEGDRDLIGRRIAARRGHFMPAALLDSQFAALEPPGPDEDPVTVGIGEEPEAIVAAILDRFGPSAVASGRSIARGEGMDIALVVSDVDGTLVTTDKRLTPATVAAVRRLGAAGIGFTLASSRPPIGLRALAEALALRLPMGAFNGSTVCGPDLAPIAETLIPEPAARAALARLDAAGVDAWVFAGGAWNLRDPDAPYADLERRTIGAEPAVVADLGPLLAGAAKIVGVSRDRERLAALEAALGAELEGQAVVHRSQPYYLDVTPPGIDKGGFVADLGRRLGIPPARIATLGDAGNDVAMFRASGLGIAMGNADPAVRRAASAVTADNDSDGFAQAIDRLVLRAR